MDVLRKKWVTASTVTMGLVSSVASLTLSLHAHAAQQNSITLSGPHNSIITTNYFENGLNIIEGTNSVSLNNLDIINEGRGHGIDNQAEISNISLKDLGIYVIRGAGIRTATSLDQNSVVNIAVSGRGTGFLFQNSDGSHSDKELILGSGYTINVNSSFGKGIAAYSNNRVENHANVNVRNTMGGPALIVGKAKENINYGNLLSASEIAPVVALDEYSGHFENHGVVQAISNSHLAIYGSRGHDNIVLTEGYVRGEIVTGTGEDKVTLGNTILEGGISMGVGNNVVNVNNTDLSTVTHITSVKDFGNVITLNNVNASAGTFAEDDLSKGTNLGDGWQAIRLNNSVLTLTDDLSLGGSGNLNIAYNSALNVAESKHLTLLGGVYNSGQLNLTQSDINGKSLTITGNYSSLDGSIAMNRVTDLNGADNAEKSSHLTILGNVTGKTKVNIHSVIDSNSISKKTDGTSFNGIISPEEAHSLITVRGNVDDDAFYVENGSLTSGPYVYGLHLVDQSSEIKKNALARADDSPSWSYRLANAMVCDTGTAGCAKAEQRPQVIAQTASYISLPSSLTQYNSNTMSQLHKRLGSLAEMNSGSGFDVFARYIGQQLDYDSDRSFAEYGYDYKLKSNAFQVGANLLHVTTETNNQFRGGVAWTHGQTKVTPESVDGSTSTKIGSDTVGVYLSYLDNSGAYADFILASGTHKAKVSTGLNGEVNDIKASGVLASIAAGYPFSIAQDTYLKPSLQLIYDGTSIKDSTDKQNAHIVYDDGDRVIGRASLELSKSWKKEAGNEFKPFVRVGYTSLFSDSAPSLAISNASASNIKSTFTTGSFGQSMDLNVGMAVNLDNKASVYGEVDYQKALGDSGSSGWNFNIGARFLF